MNGVFEIRNGVVYINGRKCEWIKVVEPDKAFISLLAKKIQEDIDKQIIKELYET